MQADRIEPQPEHLARFEQRLIDARREAIDSRLDCGGRARLRLAQQPVVGLALSGGGIRSATFSLGVMQAAAKSDMLPRFDYLSTVSGGGYAGAFIGALLRMPQGHAGTSAACGYDLAKEVLGAPCDAAAVDVARYGLADLYHPMRWLRENGRYLTPTASGDALYFVAYYLRGLAALVMVSLAVVLLGAAAWSLAAESGRSVLTSLPPGVLRTLRGAGDALQPEMDNPFGFLAVAAGLGQHAWLVWSPAWHLVGPVGGLSIALATAYWSTRAGPAGTRPITADVWWRLAALGAIGLLAAAAVVLVPDSIAPGGLSWSAAPRLARDLTGPVLIVLAAWLALQWAGTRGERSVESMRKWLTSRQRWLLVMLAGVLALAVLDTLARFIALAGGAAIFGIGAPTVSGLLAVAEVLRQLNARRPESQASALRRYGAWLAVAAAAALWALIVLACASFVYWLMLAGRSAEAPVFDWSSPPYLLILAASLLGVVLLERSPGFLNLSTLHNFYAARLTRAYLGAANAGRLSELADPQSQQKAWVSETHPGDFWTLKQYFRGADLHSPLPCAPVHLINVTVNEERGGSSSLTQRDRKGFMLSVGPAGCYLDQKYLSWQEIRKKLSAQEQQDLDRLKLGNWLAISGAAFSTGVGAETKLGFSMLAFLFNVRLGYWWKVPQSFLSELAAAHGASGTSGVRGWARASALACLYCELTGGFWGRRSRRWYLSDGGHFENTGAYELIRRRLPVVYVVDCGADPDYQFEDVANLIRKVRIDFGASVHVLDDEGLDRRIADPTHRSVFGGMKRYVPGSQAPCALLADIVYAKDGAHDTAQSGIMIIVKPALAPRLPADIVQYHRANPAFPQQTTADQFFDEAQWESYRCLGEHIAQRVFQVSIDALRPPAAGVPACAGLPVRAATRAPSLWRRLRAWVA